MQAQRRRCFFTGCRTALENIPGRRRRKPVDGKRELCYNNRAIKRLWQFLPAAPKRKVNREMYRSGRNENDSKSNWLFGSGFPVLLGFMRVFRLREGTIFWRSLLQFSPKFSQNARRILKFNIWSITQVVVRGRTRNAIGRETGARVRLPDAPPNRMDR